MTRIKSTSGYTDELPVCFVDIERFEDKTLDDDIDGIKFNEMFGKTPRVFLEKYNYQALLTGFSPVYADSAEFSDNTLVQSMPSYPDDGSICIVDNTVVVKF